MLAEREDSHAAQARQDLLEDLQPLGVELRDEDGRAGDIPAWTREALDSPDRDGLADDPDHDGDRARGPLCGKGAGHAVSHQHVGLQPNELGGQFGKTFVLPLGPPELDDEVLALGIAETRSPPRNASS